MTKNQYIDRSVQKGFLQGISGCIEHTFSLQELLKDAFREHREIVIAWIDLANAYGSLMHNLIQFIGMVPCAAEDPGNHIQLL